MKLSGRLPQLLALSVIFATLSFAPGRQLSAGVAAASNPGGKEDDPASVAGQAANTPAVYTLIGLPDGEGNDGSDEKPYEGSAIPLFLDIQDQTPTSYVWGGWQASRAGGDGTFCGGVFQFFSTENREFFLKHPRVASGQVRIRIAGTAREGGFNPVEVAAEFVINQHPNGCTGVDPNPGPNPGTGAPTINSFSAGPGTVTAGGTIRLSARATDSESTLNFLFYRSSTSQQKGSAIGTRVGSGCTGGCTVTLDVPAPIFATTQYFTVDVTDGGNTTTQTRSVQIVAQTTGCTPDQPVTNSCNGVQVSVDAGCSNPVVGGNPVQLDGAVSGAIGGTVVPGDLEWAIVSGPAGLSIANRFVAQTTLTTPDVSTDQTVTLRLTGNVGGCSAQDTLTFTLLADEPPGADVAVTLTGSPNPVSVGGQLVYTMTVHNNGPDSAPNVQAQFNLSGPGTISSVTPNQCSAQGSAVSCSLGTMQNGASTVATIGVQVTGSGTLSGSASVTSGAQDNAAGNNSANASVTAAASTADLALTKSGPQGQLPLGATFDYVLTVTNNGPDDAVNVQVTDVLPSQVSEVSSVSTVGDCSPNGQIVTCSLGTLPAQTTEQITIRVNANAAGSFTNTASASSSTADSNGANNSSSVGTEVTDAEADLAVSAAAEGMGTGGQGGGNLTLGAQTGGNGVLRVMQGSEVDYVITVVNKGPDTATNVVVSDTLPDGMDITEAAADQGMCNIVTSTVTCSLGTLDVDDSAVIRITVQANAEAQVINEVMVDSSQIDPQPDDNLAEAEVRIRSLAGLFATTHSNTLARISALANVFVGLALHNPIGAANPINVQGLSEDGQVVEDTDRDAVQALGQEAFLARQLVVDGDTILAEGLTGPVQGFFMIGKLDLKALDGIGNRLEDSPCDPDGNNCLTYLSQARQTDQTITVIFLFNPNLTNSASVTLSLYSAAGGLLGESPVDLAPSGSILATLDELFGPGLTVDDGFVRVESDHPVRGFEVVSDSDTIITIPAMRGFLTDNLAVPHFAIGSAQLTSPIRILNVGTQLSTISVRATFDDTSYGSPENFFTVAPNSVQTVDLAELLGVDVDSLPPNKVLGGFLELELDGGNVAGFPVEADVVPIITFNDGLRHTRSSLPMVEGEGERETLFLQVAHKRDLNPFQGLAIFNIRNEAVQVTVEAYNGAGVRTAQTVVPIGPHSRVVGLLNSGDFFEAQFNQQGGYLKVSSDSPVIAYSLFGGLDFLSAIGGQTPLR